GPALPDNPNDLVLLQRERHVAQNRLVASFPTLKLNRQIFDLEDSLGGAHPIPCRSLLRARSSALPIKLMPHKVMASKSPGTVVIHQALIKYLVPSAMIVPNVGVGGWMPMPMKPKMASKIIMRATSR